MSCPHYWRKLEEEPLSYKCIFCQRAFSVPAILKYGSIIVTSFICGIVFGKGF